MPSFILRTCLVMALAVSSTLLWLHMFPSSGSTIKTRPADNDDWALPAPRPKELDSAVDDILDRALWGKTATASAQEKPLTAPSWRISGVYSVADQPYAVMTMDAQPPATLKRGDVLPGGAKILNISPEKIIILLNGKQRALKVYKE